MEAAEGTITEELGAFLDTVSERVAEQLLCFVEEHAADAEAIDEEKHTLGGVVRLLETEIDPDKRVELLMRHADLPTCAQLAARALARSRSEDPRRARLLAALTVHWLNAWAAQSLLLLGELGVYEEILGARQLKYEDLWIDADMALNTLGVVLYRYQNRHSIPLIRLGLGFPDHRVRFAAARLLSPAYADDAVIGVLLGSIETDRTANSERLEQAVDNLASISPDLIRRIQPQTLLRCVFHSSPRVRAAAILALSALGEDYADVCKRLERIRTKDPNPEVRMAAIEALTNLQRGEDRSERLFLDEFGRSDGVLTPALLDYAVDHCSASQSVLVSLHMESLGASRVSTSPWRRFWSAVAIARIASSNVPKALELFHKLPSRLQPLAFTILPHPEVAGCVTPWAADILSWDIVRTAESDFVFSIQGDDFPNGDVRAGNEKIHQVQRALEIVAEAASPPPLSVLAFALDLLMKPVSWGASDNWSRARRLAGHVIVRHGTLTTLAQLEARLPGASQPDLVEHTIIALRSELTNSTSNCCGG